MLMRPKGKFDIVQGPGDMASDRQVDAIDRALKAKAIRISNLSMASETVMADSHRSGWVCLEVKNGKESSVQGELIDWQIETFVPREGPFVVVRRGRKLTIPLRPVFHGYVFVRCALMAPAILGLLSVKHVLDVVGGAEQPIPIRDEAIKKFRHLVDSGEVRKIEEKKGIAVNDFVRVDVGPYAEFHGQVKSIKLAKKFGGTNFAVVSLYVFGRHNPVRIPLAHLEKL